MSAVERAYHTDAPGVNAPAISEEVRSLEESISSTDSRASILADSVKVKKVKKTPVEAPEKPPTVAELVAQNEYGELIDETFTKATLFFGMAEQKGTLITDYDSPEGPTISLIPGSQGMIRLEQMGKISRERREEGRATLSQLTFSNLVMKDSPAVLAQHAAKTLDLLEAMEREHVSDKLQDHEG